jgi:hypothetical protein
MLSSIRFAQGDGARHVRTEWKVALVFRRRQVMRSNRN